MEDYLSYLGFTEDEIEDGIEEWEVIERENELGLRVWDWEEDYFEFEDDDLFFES